MRNFIASIMLVILTSFSLAPAASAVTVAPGTTPLPQVSNSPEATTASLTAPRPKAAPSTAAWKVEVEYFMAPFSFVSQYGSILFEQPAAVTSSLVKVLGASVSFTEATRLEAYNTALQYIIGTTPYGAQFAASSDTGPAFSVATVRTFKVAAVPLPAGAVLLLGGLGLLGGLRARRKAA